MFGYVTASFKELSKEQQNRYGAVYCGICRCIRSRSSGLSRLGLSYDMAFLALLLMSLYEPEEASGLDACILHPIKKRPWVDNEFTRYAADMNVALAYYNCADDWQDDRRLTAAAMMGILKQHLPRIEESYPRQCAAIRDCLDRLSRLEKENCPNPDEPAAAFGELMGEILVYREDLWAPQLRQLGMALGRFIYLLDAAVDYDADKRKGKYNPYLAMGTGKDLRRWEEYLVLTMGRCTESFERLPLVQDKALLDNILYSGVWVNYRRKRKERETGDE
ncbi:MAG: hypothetical protein IJA75_10150 [Oscillospiraceae bacterium]|nr:hypothetical protein [Oscillospiraceae bacterium]